MIIPSAHRASLSRIMSYWLNIFVTLTKKSVVFTFLLVNLGKVKLKSTLQLVMKLPAAVVHAVFSVFARVHFATCLSSIRFPVELESNKTHSILALLFFLLHFAMIREKMAIMTGVAVIVLFV